MLAVDENPHRNGVGFCQALLRVRLLEQDGLVVRVPQSCTPLTSRRIVSPNGLLNRLAKNVLGTALEAEMAEHLGYEKQNVTGRWSGNSRSGTRTKTKLTEVGLVEIDMPSDTGSAFDPRTLSRSDGAG